MLVSVDITQLNDITITACKFISDEGHSSGAGSNTYGALELLGWRMIEVYLVALTRLGIPLVLLWLTVGAPH